MPDCGSSSCKYAKTRTGMRINSSCRCDKCPLCGVFISPTTAIYMTHRGWCKMQAWIPPHHRGQMSVRPSPTLTRTVSPPVIRSFAVMHPIAVVKIEQDK